MNSVLNLQALHTRGIVVDNRGWSAISSCPATGEHVSPSTQNSRSLSITHLGGRPAMSMTLQLPLIKFCENYLAAQGRYGTPNACGNRHLPSARPGDRWQMQYNHRLPSASPGGRWHMYAIYSPSAVCRGQSADGRRRRAPICYLRIL